VNLLIDSDILIEVSRGRNESVIRNWKDLADSSLALSCSAVTVAEVWQGALPSEHAILDRLFSALLCLPVDQTIARLAGDYLRHYRRSHGLELGDALIAATTAVHGATLWTRNHKHYPMRDVRLWEGAAH